MIPTTVFLTPRVGLGSFAASKGTTTKATAIVRRSAFSTSARYHGKDPRDLTPGLSLRD